MKRGGGSSVEPTPQALIPTMTSNTTPYGSCFADAAYSDTYAPWKAFDKNNNTYYLRAAGSTYVNNCYFGYSFPVPVIVKYVSIDQLNDGNSGTASITVIFQGSNDGTNWVDLSDDMVVTIYSGTLYLPNNKTSYTNYRFYKKSGNNSLAAHEIQFYGYRTYRQPFYIYDYGTWNVTYDNTNYTLSGGHIPTQMGESSFTMAAGGGQWGTIGTFATIDLSAYSVLKIRAKRQSGSDNGYFGAGTNKSISSGTWEHQAPFTNSEFAELSCDISDMYGNYNIAMWNTNSTIVVEQIWLE